MSEQLRFLVENLPNLLFGFPGHRPGGLALSILLAIGGIALGFVIGNAIGAGAGSRRPLVRWICRLYVEIFRGLPLLLLVLIVYQLGGRIRFGLEMSPRDAALISLALYSGAYQAELVRAGLRNVPQQLVDSAQLLGSMPLHLYWNVRLRYAFRIMLPAFTGEAISLFKDTSVVTIIGVSELMTVARVTLGSDVTYAPYWVGLYLLVGALYFCIAFGLSQAAQHWERQHQSGDLVHSLANY